MDGHGGGIMEANMYSFCFVCVCVYETETLEIICSFKANGCQSFYNLCWFSCFVVSILYVAGDIAVFFCFLFLYLFLFLSLLTLSFCCGSSFNPRKDC